MTICVSDAVYTHRRRLRGYNVAVDAYMAVTPGDAARLIAANAPDWRRPEHQELAAHHKAKAERARQRWNDLVEQASQAVFGRPFAFTDYRISGIANDAFLAKHKRHLRRLAHLRSKHQRLAEAHEAATRLRRY